MGPMKQKNEHTGVMVSFSLGMAAGLYATSKEVRNGMNSLGRRLFTKPERMIIEGEGEYETLTEHSHAGLGRVRRFGRSLRNHVMAASRARIIKKGIKNDY